MIYGNTPEKLNPMTQKVAYFCSGRSIIQATIDGNNPNKTSITVGSEIIIAVPRIKPPQISTRRPWPCPADWGVVAGLEPEGKGEIAIFLKHFSDEQDGYDEILKFKRKIEVF